jgi:hypothetical protein
MVRAEAGETNPNGQYIGQGLCHLMILRAVEGGGDDAGKLLVDVNVLASTNPANTRITQTEKFAISGKGAGRLFMMLVATGIITKEQWEAAKEANQGINFDEKLLHGRQFGAGFEPEEFNGKTYNKMGFRIYSLDDPAMEKCPKDQAAYAIWLKGRNQAGGPSAGAAPAPGPSPAPIDGGHAAAGGDAFSRFA